jgi:hypothetical protein
LGTQITQAFRHAAARDTPRVPAARARKLLQARAAERARVRRRGGAAARRPAARAARAPKRGDR